MHCILTFTRKTKLLTAICQSQETHQTETMTVTAATEPPLMPLMEVYLRRKFFEPQLMSNPPPMAEKFLFDLRNMIGVARDRIRTRRHVPRLPPVVESEDEAVPNAATATQNVDDNDKEIDVMNKEIENFKGKINANQNEMPVNATELEVCKFECEEEEKELALSMEQIMREQQQKQSYQNLNKIEDVLMGGTEENSSPRSLDSGRGGSEPLEEEMMTIDTHHAISENTDEAGNSGKPIEVIEVKRENTAIDTDDQMMIEKISSSYKDEMTSEINIDQQRKINSALERVFEQETQQRKTVEKQRQISIDSQAHSIPSRIPVGTASTSKSPRMHLKFAALTHHPPPLPPRAPLPPCSSKEFSDAKINEINEPQRSLQFPVARRRARDHLEQQSNSSKGSTQLSTYTVCPPSYASDRMKKSLPRRKKVVMPIGAVIPTSTSTAVV